jgi:hypothetical protein
MKTPDEITAALQSNDDAQRAAAISAAAECGAACVSPAANLLASPDTETRRAARRALQAVVRATGRTGKLGSAAREVEKSFLAALAGLQDVQARRDAIWFLSEVGDSDTVRALDALLAHAALREDARCALERIPGKQSLRALENALAKAAPEFQPAIADSLRKRGAKVENHPSRRLVPVKPTTVRPVTS